MERKEIEAGIELVDPDEQLVYQLGTATIFYRRISLDDQAALRKKYKPKQRRVVRRQAQEEEESNTALSRAMLKYIVTGWEGITFRGSLVPCTDDPITIDSKLFPNGTKVILPADTIADLLEAATAEQGVKREADQKAEQEVKEMPAISSDG